MNCCPAAAGWEYLSSTVGSLQALQGTTASPIRLLLLLHGTQPHTLSPNVPHHKRGPVADRKKNHSFFYLQDRLIQLRWLIKSFFCLEDYIPRLLPSKRFGRSLERATLLKPSQLFDLETSANWKATGSFLLKVQLHCSPKGYGTTNALTTHSYTKADPVSK